MQANSRFLPMPGRKEPGRHTQNCAEEAGGNLSSMVGGLSPFQPSLPEPGFTCQITPSRWGHSMSQSTSPGWHPLTPTPPESVSQREVKGLRIASHKGFQHDAVPKAALI